MPTNSPSPSRPESPLRRFLLWLLAVPLTIALSILGPWVPSALVVEYLIQVVDTQDRPVLSIYTTAPWPAGTPERITLESPPRFTRVFPAPNAPPSDLECFSVDRLGAGAKGDPLGPLSAKVLTPRLNATLDPPARAAQAAQLESFIRRVFDQGIAQLSDQPWPQRTYATPQAPGWYSLSPEPGQAIFLRPTGLAASALTLVVGLVLTFLADRFLRRRSGTPTQSPGQPAAP